MTATIEADWLSCTASNGKGVLDGVEITATASEISPIFGIAEDERFWIGEKSGWNTRFPLSVDTKALVATDVNAGDWHDFRFASAVTSPLLYIENFDSNSEATVTITGGDSVSLVTGSPSITFVVEDNDSGILHTTNPTFDGEGDAILLLEGDVTGVRIDYTGGDGANGVFFGFALNEALSVPEPAAHLLLIVAGMFLLSARRRR